MIEKKFKTMHSIKINNKISLTCYYQYIKKVHKNAWFDDKKTM